MTAAAELFAERGVDVPLDEIARRAGVSIGTLYNHFPNRGALLDAVLPDWAAEVDRLAAATLADPDPWRNRLRNATWYPGYQLDRLRQLAASTDVAKLPVVSIRGLAGG